MALTRIDNPTPSAPATLADYVQILAVQNGAILQALRGNSHACIDFTNNLAKAGTVFYVAGVLYKAATDQTISGTPSKYVKITPSGATASIAYVSSLVGVSWNDAQSGYYDAGPTNLYVFDEARAVYDGVVSTPKTNEGQIAYIVGSLSIKNNLTVGDTLNLGNDLIVGDDITASGDIQGAFLGVSQIGSPADGYGEVGGFLKRKIISIGDWDMDANATLNVAHGLTLGNIRRVTAFIREDAPANTLQPLDIFLIGTSTNVEGHCRIAGANVALSRRTGGIYDDIAYNATGYNRGWILIEYEP